MFAVQRQASAQRLQEVRLLHQIITSMEGTDPLQPDPDNAVLLRGLFFVELYGYFEYSVNQFVSATIGIISSAGVSFSHMESVFYSIALDAPLTSVQTTQGSAKWKKRVELFTQQSASGPCAVNDVVLGAYLQNIWVASLEQVFSCFGIVGAVVPSNRHRDYIDELTDKRNAVAHGRESSVDVWKEL